MNNAATNLLDVVETQSTAVTKRAINKAIMVDSKVKLDVNPL